MHIPEVYVLMMEPERRNWMMRRFVDQKKRENDEMERQRREAKQASKHK